MALVLATLDLAMDIELALDLDMAMALVFATEPALITELARALENKTSALVSQEKLFNYFNLWHDQIL